MKEEFVIIKEELEKIISSALLSNLLNYIDKDIRLINKIRDLINLHLINLKESTITEIKFHNEIKCYNNAFLELLNKRDEIRSSGNSDKELSGLSEKYNYFLGLTDYKRIEFQDNERFKLMKGDSTLNRIFKIIKSIFYFLTTFFGRIRNLSRKISGQYEKPLRQWKRKIYYRNLLKLIIRNRLLLNFLDIFRDMNRDLISALHTAWMSEEKINNHFTDDILTFKPEKLIPDETTIAGYEREINSALKILQKTKDGLKQNSALLLDNIINELDTLYSKAGTVEFLSWHYSERIVEKEYNELITKYKNSVKGWDNTLYALLEAWKFNKDIYINEILNVQEMHLLKDESRYKIVEKVIPGLEEIGKKLKESKNRIEKLNTTNLREALSLEKWNLSESLGTGLINKTAETLLDEQIPESVDKLEVNLKVNIENTLTKRAIVKTEMYNKEIRNSEIEYINPLELIGFEIFPAFLKETHKLKSSIIEHIDEVQNELDNIYGIADLNLESAINTVGSDKNDLPGNDPKSIAAEGLHMSITKVYEIKSKLMDIYDNIKNLSSESIASLNKKIEGLPNSDNFNEIKLKLDDAKTREKSEESKNKTLFSLKNILPDSIRQNSPLSHKHMNFSAHSGSEPKKIQVSGGISYFLNETGNPVNKLPYVYQRLFRIEPLADEKFYEPRTREMNLLNSAFENWTEGKYAPVVLVGEKGSGITTLINIFLKNIRNNLNSYVLIKGKVESAIAEEEGLIKYLGSQLGINSADKNDILYYLNFSGKKRIIVIEKMQRLFLKKIGGFKALKLLFEIISATSRNVFWMLTANIYAFNYMDKVLNISDYFGYVIKMNPLSDQQIIDIILHRHGISGYNIYFRPSPMDLQNKNFIKLPENRKQIYLNVKYFSGLNKFAKSNLGVSLLFWMRSVIEVKNDTITISSLDELDFSSLYRLSDEKIFTLNSILVHDGLTMENHSAIFNQDIEKSRLIFLSLNDDGIINKNNAGYIINPYLYRQTVNLLHTKKILH